MCDQDKNSTKNSKGDEDMAKAIADFPNNNTLRKPRAKRTDLLSSTTEEDFKVMNQITKKQRGLSNITYKRLVRGE